MSCTRSYRKSVFELLICTTSFKKIWRAGKYPRLTKIQLKLIPAFHSTIPFHCSIPLIPDSLQEMSLSLCKLSLPGSRHPPADQPKECDTCLDVNFMFVTILLIIDASSGCTSPTKPTVLMIFTTVLVIFMSGCDQLG